MDFETSDDQRAFRDSLSRFLDTRYTHEHRREVVRGGVDTQTWPALAELGVTALLVPETAGGLGGSAEDLLPVCETLGAALVLEPVLGSCVMSTIALARYTAPAAQALLARMAAGDARTCWVDAEDDTPVPCGMSADAFVVARTDAHGGRQLVLIDDATQISRTPCTLVDDTPAARVLPDSGSVLLRGDEAARVIHEVQLWGEFAACGESVGLVQRALSLCLVHLGERKQFGHPLADYQALRHHVSTIAADLEVCRAITIGASVALDDAVRADDFCDAAMRVSQARAVTSRLSMRACEAAVQIHGGIGMTTEYPVGALLRRAVCLNHLFGSSREHALRLARMPALAACSYF